MNHQEVFNRIVKSGRPRQIAASFSSMSELTEEQKRHFIAAPYLWKAMQGKIYGGVLLDESLGYIHLVLVSEEIFLALQNSNSALLTA